MNPGYDRSQKKPILVTGGARSGTTWAGRTIAKSPSIRYVHEPFNITGPYCSCGIKFNFRYYYISEDNDELLNEHIKHILGPPTNIYQLLNLIREV